MDTELRLLLVYPNIPHLNPPPVGIGSLAAVVKAAGHEVQVFDTTFYLGDDQLSDKAQEEVLGVRPFEFEPRTLPSPENDVATDFLAKVKSYKPHIIGLSALESTWDRTVDLLDVLRPETHDAVVLVGGIFPTFAQDIVLDHPAVNAICVGEGEGPLVDLCDRIKAGTDFSDVPNLWVKEQSGAIRKNPPRAPLDISDLDVPDYSVFDSSRFLRPMAGKIYRTAPVETVRGCPYKCAFCNSPSMYDLYSNNKKGSFLRKKSIEQIQNELRILYSQYDVEYFYFCSDTFLVMSDSEFDEFAEVYSEFKLPFWIQTRPETIKPKHIKLLKEIGCHRISMGLEHGNEKFRAKLLKRDYKNADIINVSHDLADAGIALSVNNILGFPGETRELVFDTINLNRQMRFDTTSGYAFTPFHGTELRDVSVSKGFIKQDYLSRTHTIGLGLDQPQLPRSEVDGLRKTFALYARLPKSFWPQIKIAEKDDPEGRASFAELAKVYQERFFANQYNE